jgi:23S rRNA (adenine2030-N6)-methyltransferase
MNYRHAYHAGNFGDVLKHLTLVLLLEHLGRKETPYFVLDTHAGRGRYRLLDPAMQKGGEFRTGILRVLGAPDPPPPVARYLDQVRTIGCEQGELVAYPGSPSITRALLRPQDRAALVEADPDEAAALRSEVRGDGRFGVHERDGYEALVALTPPRERRGLVLIDPPFELADEFDRIGAALLRAFARWPTAVFAVWFPLTAGGSAERFKAEQRASGVRRQLIAELLVRPADTPVGLVGAGVLVVNPPWQLDVELRTALTWLTRALGPPPGRYRLDWLVPE